LLTNSYIIVYGLDFSKAFDTDRHETLLHKLAMLNLPDHVYNWLVDFFNGHSHCTEYRCAMSGLKEISANIIQGSGIGPASYVVNAVDLQPKHQENTMCKYADDTYLIIAAAMEETRQVELDNVALWAKANNLKLNQAKTMEIIFFDSRRRTKPVLPPTISGIARTNSLKILGVTVNSNLTMTEHVGNIIGSSAQTNYALKVLHAHGMTDSALQVVFRSVIIGKLMYASAAWWGFAKAAECQRVDAFIADASGNAFVQRTFQLLKNNVK
jgi:hypothetical protein